MCKTLSSLRCGVNRETLDRNRTEQGSTTGRQMPGTATSPACHGKNALYNNIKMTRSSVLLVEINRYKSKALPKTGLCCNEVGKKKKKNSTCSETDTCSASIILNVCQPRVLLYGVFQGSCSLTVSGPYTFLYYSCNCLSMKTKRTN